MKPKPLFLIVVDALTLIMVLGTLTVILFFTPVEVVMGPVQKVFYFHLSAAWAGMLSFIF